MISENMDKEIAIRISGVKKQYRLGQIGGGTLQGDLQSWWARVRGKEDPNTKIGQEQRLVGQSFMALNGIDLTVYKGEALGIIGSNGAGKSTLLKLLSRVTAPSAGSLDIYGRIASMLEVGTGFNGEMTGRENVYMNGAILGMTKAEIDAKMEDIIEFSEVRDFIDTPVKRYSSGMYVKLAFSVAAHLDSEIMIMDEVLAVGDMAFQKKCLDKMKQAAKQEGRTVLYVSHNMNTIRRLCDRCIVLDAGTLAYDGDVESAIARYMEVKENKQTEIDLSHSPHLEWIISQKIKLLSASYYQKDNNAFLSTEKIALDLDWKNLVDTEHVNLRIEIWNMEDVTVASYIIFDMFNGKKDSVIKARLELDISMLKASTYHMLYTFFEKDESGNNKEIEAAFGLFFEIIAEDDANKRLTWNIRNWGSIELPTPSFDILS